MAERDRPHVLVRSPAATEKYRPHPNPIPPREPAPPGNRTKHAAILTRSLRSALREALERRSETDLEVIGAAPGVYVQFDSQPGFELMLESLENKRKGIELVAVVQEEKTALQRATVFVPDGGVKHFIERFEEYATEETRNGTPKNRPMVERISALRLATLQALWTDAPDAYPRATSRIWWEVWLRRTDGDELGRFLDFAGQASIPVAARRLEFPDRIVLLARGTAATLSLSLDVLNDIAEVRRAKETADTFLRMGPAEQDAWLKELLERITPADADAPAVCILDTGVNRGHPLLAASLAASDLHALDPSWKTSDHDGHGTEMAGLALYGDLTPLLESRDPVGLTHRLESVKMLAPPGLAATRPDLYGAAMAEATSRVEIESAARRRCFSMSFAAKDSRDRGQPTSWSSALDALAAGRSFNPSTHGLEYLDDGEPEAHRLFVVCAGNVEPSDRDHLAISDTEAIHDPGQAWNALTVGAFTTLTELDAESTGNGLSPLAAAGELSPYSSTSVRFGPQWPVKPDVVLEGGNVGAPTGPGELEFPQASLSLLTTHRTPLVKPFVPSWATSAATAQASRIAGTLAAEYPALWPEAIRALIVHSASWTPRMRSHLTRTGGRQERRALLRRYGYGVPDLEKARRSASNAVALVVQDRIHPFRAGTLREMHVHQLPWPTDALAALGSRHVRLRVTLSYFVEPNPSRRGWRARHQYASHGLRFEVKGADQSVAAFRKRLNAAALAEDEQRPGAPDSPDWFFGTTVRNNGSLHSDLWEGPAEELAKRGCVGIFPVSGWWKQQKRRDRSEGGVRYALMVSIETDEESADLWTPVEVAARVLIEAGA